MSYYRIRYILSIWKKIFQSLLFPGIQLTRSALKYLTHGQITTPNNKTYKKATSRAGIFVWFRGMNILIICPRNRRLECRLPALQCRGIATVLLTLTLSFFFCLIIYLSYAMLIYATFAPPLSYIPVSFLEVWYYTGARYHITISSITLVFLSNASSNIDAI